MAYNSANQSSTKKPPVSCQTTHYALLGLYPSAGETQIRQAYRDLSRLYHPDTTNLPPQVAKQKFQQLNEAYATLSSPERRRLYDLNIGYSRVAVAAPQSTIYTKRHSSINAPSINQQSEKSASVYLDPTDRPLSAGELFALFIMLLTLVACLIIAIIVGLSHPRPVIQTEFAQELGLVVPALSPMESHEELKETATLEKAN